MSDISNNVNNRAVRMSSLPSVLASTISGDNASDLAFDINHGPPPEQRRDSLISKVWTKLSWTGRSIWNAMTACFRAKPELQIGEPLFVTRTQFGRDPEQLLGGQTAKNPAQDNFSNQALPNTVNGTTGDDISIEDDKKDLFPTPENIGRISTADTAVPAAGLQSGLKPSREDTGVRNPEKVVDTTPDPIDNSDLISDILDPVSEDSNINEPPAIESGVVPRTIQRETTALASPPKLEIKGWDRAQYETARAVFEKKK